MNKLYKLVSVIYAWLSVIRKANLLKDPPVKGGHKGLDAQGQAGEVELWLE
jgi:hypothetical protein